MAKDAGSETRIPGGLPQISTGYINDASYEKQSLDVVPKSTHQEPVENPFKSLLKPTQSENPTPMPDNIKNGSIGKQ